MLYLVGLLLFGQLVAAAQFGNVFRRDALDNKVAESNASAISIIGGAYNAALSLDSGWCNVLFLDGMQVDHIPKDKKLKSLNSGEHVKVQPGDVLIIYEPFYIDLDMYKDATADNLQRKIENETSEAAVFGVVIQDGSALKKEAAQSELKKEVAQLAPNSDFKELLYKPNGHSKVEVLKSTVRITTTSDIYAMIYLDTERNLKVFLRGKLGVKVALIRDNVLISKSDSQHGQELAKVKQGDRIIILVAEYWGASYNARADAVVSEVVEAGIGKLNNAYYSQFTAFAAEIDEAADYLEDITLFGHDTKVENALLISKNGNPSWLFKGNTMIVRNDHSVAIHIKKNKKIKRDGGNKHLFPTSDRVELSDLEPGDIVVIVTCHSDDDTIYLATLNNALSDCINSTELESKLNGLRFESTTGVMAAIVSGKIQSVKAVAKPKEEKENFQMTDFNTIRVANVDYTRTVDKIKVESTRVGVDVGATITLTNRNKVTISQRGGAVALFINEDGLRYGNTVAFESILRKLKMEDKYVAPEHVLEAKDGDFVMVLLPPENGECKWNPLDISGLLKDDIDDIKESLDSFFSDGTIAVVTARIKKSN